MRPTLFGTDGIRGVAGRAPLDRATVARLGAALAGHLAQAKRPMRILMAGDTRASTPEIAGWLAGAFTAAGGETSWAGVLPTPAVSQLIRSGAGYGGGVIVSASHNPAADNGIKLVGPRGSKWTTTEERLLEERIAETEEPRSVRALPPVDPALASRFAELLIATLPPTPLDGMRVVIDAANGAATPVAAGLFTALGASVSMLNDRPDGVNINASCGALHPEGLAAEVVRTHADGGVALDGDADRAILVTRAGRILNGDDVLLIWARALAAAGTLNRSRIVATVMSNLALERALEAEGIDLVRCPVGDREVWEAMQRSGAVLGGEQSGHVICSRYSVTGDGLLTAAHLFAIARRRGVRLDDLVDLVPFPQVLHNVRLARRPPGGEVPELATAVRDASAELDGRGRVLVRFSGTEPLLRIMVEAERHDLAESIAARLTEIAHRTVA